MEMAVLESWDAKKIASALKSDEECINHVEKQTGAVLLLLEKGLHC